jgi:tetratricopeptide (TPR) repeat protein
MKRSGYLKISLFSVAMLAVTVLPGFGQAAQTRTPQTRTQPEFDSYSACYNEKDFTKKADLCQKFVDRFQESDFLITGYKFIIQSYYQTGNWQLLMDAADKAAGLPNADDNWKDYAYQSAMVGAQKANNLDRAISYGDKVLQIDPNNLTALYTISSIITQKSSTDIPQLEKAAEMARKALLVAASMMDKASPEEKPQLVQMDGLLHGTLGLISYNEMDYKKSIQEYQAAVKDDAKDETAHFLMAYDYIQLMTQASRDFQTSLNAENAAKDARADQPTVDDLAAKRADFQERVLTYRDLVIDELAITVAINGTYTAQAKPLLIKQWTDKNNSTAGLDEFVNLKKTQLGG